MTSPMLPAAPEISATLPSSRPGRNACTDVALATPVVFAVIGGTPFLEEFVARDAGRCAAARG
jgi:hypothetical protein